MTALQTTAKTSAHLAALDAARAATVAYCTDEAKDHSHATLRDLTAIEAMYAYFGSDETSL